MAAKRVGEEEDLLEDGDDDDGDAPAAEGSRDFQNSSSPSSSATVTSERRNRRRRRAEFEEAWTNRFNRNICARTNRYMTCNLCERANGMAADAPHLPFFQITCTCTRILSPSFFQLLHVEDKDYADRLFPVRKSR